MYVFNESYESAMNVPVPVRKWLIKRWNKQKETEQKANSKQSDISKPLSPQDRLKMIKNAQNNNAPSKRPVTPSEFLTPRRS